LYRSLFTELHEERNVFYLGKGITGIDFSHDSLRIVATGNGVQCYDILSMRVLSNIDEEVFLVRLEQHA